MPRWTRHTPEPKDTRQAPVPGRLLCLTTAQSMPRQTEAWLQRVSTVTVPAIVAVAIVVRGSDSGSDSDSDCCRRRPAVVTRMTDSDMNMEMETGTEMGMGMGMGMEMEMETGMNTRESGLRPKPVIRINMAVLHTQTHL